MIQISLAHISTRAELSRLYRGHQFHFLQPIVLNSYIVSHENDFYRKPNYQQRLSTWMLKAHNFISLVVR